MLETQHYPIEYSHSVLNMDFEQPSCPEYAKTAQINFAFSFRAKFKAVSTFIGLILAFPIVRVVKRLCCGYLKLNSQVEGGFCAVEAMVEIIIVAMDVDILLGQQLIISHH